MTVSAASAEVSSDPDLFVAYHEDGTQWMWPWGFDHPSELYAHPPGFDCGHVQTLTKPRQGYPFQTKCSHLIISSLVPIPKDTKPAGKYGPVRIHFDPAYGGFLGFEVDSGDARTKNEWYSRLETLPSRYRQFVTVPKGGYCRWSGCLTTARSAAGYCGRHNAAARRQEGRNGD